MSKILEKLAKHKAQKEEELVNDLRLLSERLAREKLEKLNTARGVAREYGQDEDLDLLPLSKNEDLLFVYEGSPIAYYCEERLRERGAEEALRAVFAQSKRMTCGKCGKIWTKCECNSFFSGLIGQSIDWSL